MSKFIDNAYPILRGDPVLSPQNRSDIWDLFHVHSKDAGELAQHLQAVPGLPDDTRAQLIAAKSKPSVEYAPHEEQINRVVQAIERMGKLDPQLLDLAERHGNVFNTYLNQQKDAEE
jgi:hypothetical protein